MYSALSIWQSGKVLWSTDRFGAGSVTLAGNRLVIVRESGELVLAAASPAVLPADRSRADSAGNRSRLSGARRWRSVCSQR